MWNGISNLTCKKTKCINVFILFNSISGGTRIIMTGTTVIIIDTIMEIGGYKYNLINYLKYPIKLSTVL